MLKDIIFATVSYAMSMFLNRSVSKKLLPIIGSLKVIENRKKGRPFICFKDQTGLQMLALTRKRACRSERKAKK